MRARAAVFYEAGKPFVIEDIEVAEPKAREVRLKIIATGLCHSDYHLITAEYGNIQGPLIGGHEGAGIVESIGPEVHDLKPGDHVLLTFVPVCGKCAFCGMGLSSYCDMGANTLSGQQLDGTFRTTLLTGEKKGQAAGQFALIGTFANYAVVPVESCVKIHESVPLEKICLVGCCVPTGFGAATVSAGTRPGEVVTIFGIGGIGANAIQGALAAGARMIIAVDPVPFKREMARKLGATHVIDPTAEDVRARIWDLTYNRYSDRVIVTIGNPTAEDIGLAFKCVRKAGRMVLVSVTNNKVRSIPISPFELGLLGKQLVGSLFGDSTTRETVPRLVELFSAGKLKLDELITRTYKLDDLNQGYQDMVDGKNIRGVVIHEH
jgi:S-(hydroxymethyl)glutathione dehydrogenase/alcohol dehydrogenase